jgi:hypothetical protein
MKYLCILIVFIWIIYKHIPRMIQFVLTDAFRVGFSYFFGIERVDRLCWVAPTIPTCLITEYGMILMSYERAITRMNVMYDDEEDYRCPKHQNTRGLGYKF